MTIDDSQELAQRCAQAMWKTDAASQSMNLVLDTVGPGTATLRMMIDKSMANGHGTCHGGYMFTLADSAFAFACNTYDQRTVAQHCSISYISPAFVGDELIARACEVSRVGRNGIYDVIIYRDDDSVVAQFRGYSRTIKGRVLS